MKRSLSVLTAIVCLFAFVFSARSVAGDENEAGDSIRIVSVTPNEIEPGAEVTFTVSVDYSLQSSAEGIIYLGINNINEDRFRLYDHVIVEQGSGTVTLSAAVATSSEWETGVYVNLSEYPHEGSWVPLAYEEHWFGAETETTVSQTLPNAVRYVPYSYAISGRPGASYALDGALPAGLTLGADGVISGMPTELGVFNFAVTETYSEGTVRHECSLTCVYQGAVDVEAFNLPGYGFVVTGESDGRVHDQLVSSAEELTDQTMHLEGPFSEFRALYIDAQLLTRDVDYTATEGSVVIVILDDTIERYGSGTHTLSAVFETAEEDGGSLRAGTVYTNQTYTVMGIPGTNVNVEVKGEPVLWWDAEPYIDANNRTMTPFRIIGEALGLTAGWDAATREAYFTDGSRTIYFPINSLTARTSEGTTIEMDTAAVAVNGRTFAPVRYLAEYFGYTVSWTPATRTARIEGILTLM